MSIISLEGRMFPVDIHYLEEPCQDYVETAIQTAFDIHVKVCFLHLDIILIYLKFLYELKIL